MRRLRAVPALAARAVRGRWRWWVLGVAAAVLALVVYAVWPTAGTGGSSADKPRSSGGDRPAPVVVAPVRTRDVRPCGAPAATGAPRGTVA